MKKNYNTLKMLLLFLLPIGSMAQVVNGTFENVKPNFLPSNWGMTFLQQVGIDPETGESFGDQIQYTWCVPSMVYASTEAKTGEYAMEISNAYNLTQDVVIPGIATIFSDPEQDGPGWNPGISVEPTDNIFMIGFYYKFLPAGNDIAEARIHVADSDGNEIGSASIDISGTNNLYQYIYEPIQYTSTATPASMTISFSMAKEGSVPAFGSRLIIDNVVTNWEALNIIDMTPLNEKITVYPTLADQVLNVDSRGLTQGSVTYKVTNSEGKVVRQNSVSNSDYVYSMDVSSLSSGMYFISIDSSAGHTIKKFIKK